MPIVNPDSRRLPYAASCIVTQERQYDDVRWCKENITGNWSWLYQHDARTLMFEEEKDFIKFQLSRT